MDSYLPFVVAGLLLVGLVVWSVTAHRRKRRDVNLTLRQAGFSACPERKAWLEETVAKIENNAGFDYEVREPKCLSGPSPVYYYVKRCGRAGDEEPRVEEEILFAVKRPSPGGLVLVVKPSSLASGLATRMLGALATSSWDVQPDDLHRLDLPADLKETNLLGALGPPGASLYDLVDAGTLSVVQGLGDAGGMFVRFRGAWCTVASTSSQIPFRVDELVARIRPVLGAHPST